jgi:hypothetical protein
MKPLVKLAGIVAASVAGVLVLAIASVLIDSQRMLDRSYPRRPSTAHTWLSFQPALTATPRV